MVKRLSSRVKHDVKCGEVHWMEEEMKDCLTKDPRNEKEKKETQWE